MCVRAPVHKIKVHTNLLTLQTVCIRRIEVEVSFHTFKKKKNNFSNHVICKTLLKSPTIPRIQVPRRARASMPLLPRPRRQASLPASAPPRLPLTAQARPLTGATQTFSRNAPLSISALAPPPTLRLGLSRPLPRSHHAPRCRAGNPSGFAFRPRPHTGRGPSPPRPASRAVHRVA